MARPSKESSTKFIGRNRAPRVHITYDVETYGSERKVELPFVMGVMADLSGKPEEPLAAVEHRTFDEVDMDNFDSFLKKTRPRIAFPIDNELEPGSKMQVELTFESLEDFSPDRVAQRIEPLRKLLEARTQLSNLLTFMDGKMGAENVLENLLKDPALMKSMMAAPKPQDIATGNQQPDGEGGGHTSAGPDEKPPGDGPTIGN